jgi:hypothetical protein
VSSTKKSGAIRTIKVRRSSDWPRDVSGELRFKYRYPHKLPIEEAGEKYVLRYRRSRWRRFLDGTGRVRQREFFCWITKSGRDIGMFEFALFASDDFIENEELLDNMDSGSASTYDVGVLLTNAWTDVASEVLCYGPALEFRLAWMVPNARAPGIWITASKALADAEARNCSIWVMKAFPLEYVKPRPDEPPLPRGADSGMRRRRAAMIRYYGRVFGVTPFPGAPGRKGWLWRARPNIVDLIPTPRASKISP